MLPITSSAGSRFIALAALGLGCGLAPRAHAQTLLHYYSFDSGTLSTSGASITGASGTGGTLIPYDVNFRPTVDASGKFGGAANFSGGAQALEIGTFSGGGTMGSSFSISFWMKTPDVTANSTSYVLQTGASSGEPQNAVLFGYVVGQTELYASSAGYSGVTNPRPVSGITLSPALNNTWFNVAYTYDGTTFKGYLNGAEVFSTAANFSLTAAGGFSVGGARNGAAAVPGSLDDVAVWSGALSSTQITALQTSTALSVSAIPEPSTYAAIFGAGALGFAVWRRRKTAKAARAEG